MIVYDLICSHGHRFEGWFASSADYRDQADRALVQCPQCGCDTVAKAPMAPAVPRKGASASRAGGGAERQAAMLAGLARAQARALDGSRWVGDRFADQSRAMHYGERDAEPIHGHTTLREAKALVEEGVKVAPLPLPVTPPERLN